MKIDWANSYRADGSPRRPPPNALHGWLAKMRGTLVGDEDTRSRGMREMRDARRYKEAQKERAKMARSNSTGFMGLLTKVPEPQSQPSRQAGRRLTRDDRSMSYSSRKSAHSTSSKRPRPPLPSRRGTGMSSRSMPGSWPDAHSPVDLRSRSPPSRKGSRR